MKPLIFIAVLMSAFQSLYAQPDFETLRRRMVAEQLSARDVRNPEVLKAMGEVPRHLFVPETQQAEAYGDHPLAIGSGQTISQPYMVAIMTQALKLEKGNRVLEIGTGSGYQAAVLAQMGMEVYTIEIVEELGVRARALLQQLGYDKVHVRIGDGYHGWPEEAPFDAIIVTAGAPDIPEKLLQQLDEDGRMVIPVGGARTVQELLLVTVRNGKVRKKELMPVRFVPFTRKPDHP